MDPLTVILNASAGGGHSAETRDKIATAFTSHGVSTRVVLARNGREIEEFARRAVAQGDAVVAAAGGDGTISTVASVLAGAQTALGILPMGTLNHFAKDLRIPLDLQEAAGIVTAGRIVTVDVAEVNGRTFVNNSSLGLYPETVRRREQLQRLGRAKWPAFVWAALTSLRLYPFLTVRLFLEGKELRRRTPLVFVGNNDYRMEGLNIGSRESLREGILSIYVTHRTTRTGLVLLALSAVAGRLRRSRSFDIEKAPELWIETRRRTVRVAIDGEVEMMATPLHYRIRAGALRVVAPEAGS